jgi:L-malate glycosyltransferase
MSTMAETRVLHVIKGLGRGGAERLLVSTIGNHHKSYRFDVVYFLPWKNQLVGNLESLGSEVHCLKAKSVGMMLIRLPALCRLVRKGRYDIIHAHLPWSGILARLAGMLTGVKVVYTEHNLVSRYKLITRFANRLTFGFQSAVIAVSEKAAADIRSTYGTRRSIDVVPNGVDLRNLPSVAADSARYRNLHGIPIDAFVIGTVAVFTNQKRLDRWLAICRELIKIHNTYFVIVGDGVLRSKIEFSATDLVGLSRLRFTGLSAVPEQWMACMDVFLMTSDYEGLPVALLEAMGIGCVPVATAVGGVPSVIEDGKNGFLFAPEDESSAVDTIRMLAEDLEMLKKISQESMSTVSSGFGISRMTEAVELVYQRIMESRVNVPPEGGKNP